MNHPHASKCSRGHKSRLGRRLHRRLGFESLESRQLLSITLPSIANVSLPAGTSMYVPLNASDPGATVNYSVTASDYSKLTPVMMPESNPTLELTVNINGVDQVMDFQLLNNLAPNTVAHIESLVNSGFYDGLQIYRNGKDQNGNPFVIQGGNDPPSGAINKNPPADAGSIAEEFNPDLQFTSAGLLAMARSSAPGTSSTEFFVTEEPGRFLDYNYTIFGVQTTGKNVISTISAMPDESSSQDPSGLGYLVTPLTITSAKIINDTQNGVLQLTAPAGVTGTVTVTVTGSDGTNSPVTQSFTVTIQADSSSNPANPFKSVTPAAPTAVAFLPPSGGSSTATNLNNASSASALQFQVSGVTSGDLVEILADGNVIGQATASGATVTVTTDGSTKLTDGLHQFTAIQIAPNQTVSVTESGSSTASSQTANVPSLNSPSVKLTVDTAAPTFNFTTVTAAVVGVPYSCQVATNSDPSGAVTYQLTQEPTGMTINSTTGLISWTPTSGQTPSQQVTVQATDPAGNTGQQQFTVNILATNAAPVLTAASPSLGSTDNNVTKTINLTAFINNGAGTTTITDSDSGAAIGGIALIGTTGKGTWQYSLDGTTFSPVGTVSASSALLLAKNAELRYIPDNKSGETATISYRAWDTTGGANGVRDDLTQSGLLGGSGPFSSATDIASLTVKNVANSSVSGYVYIDANNDGRMDNAESGLASVSLKLTGQGGSVTWAQSNAAGAYSFQGLAAGTYTLEVVPPSQLLLGQASLGTVGGTSRGTTSGNTVQLQLGANESGSNYDFAVLGVQPSLVSLRLFLASTPPMGQYIQKIHTAPTVSLGSSGATYTAGGSPVAIAPAATISSPGSATLASMTVTLQKPLDGSSEQLQAATSGTSLTSSYSNGVLTITGAADAAAYQMVLQGITYNDTASSPTVGTRTISVVVNDGTDTSSAVTGTLNVGGGA